ncbi:hypothetical protein JT06_10075 [Desulfobulbus sp. Tol-SR]|nr:hypothetical protein JT06_10075 [Desulfobulbus sp. Tol-SR]
MLCRLHSMFVDTAGIGDTAHGPEFSLLHDDWRGEGPLWDDGASRQGGEIPSRLEIRFGDQSNVMDLVSFGGQ